jgi:hypothetical protein
MSWATADPLELLLHPLEPAVFLAEHWAWRPAVLRHTPDRWAGLFECRCASSLCSSARAAPGRGYLEKRS